MDAPDFSHNPFSIDYTANTTGVMEAPLTDACRPAGTGRVTDLVWSDGTQNLPA